MKIISHHEPHKTSFTLSDVILGGQDGLVNVLGVILGVAAATQDQRIVLAAGLAATFAESVSMAAVAYTSTLADADFYHSEKEREIREIEELPEKEKAEVRAIYEKKGFKGKILDEIVATITADKQIWLAEMMDNELNLQPIEKHEASKSARVVGLSAFAGSLIPLAPYFFLNVQASTILALIISSIMLFAVGSYKARVTVGRWYKSGLQMMVIGIISALVGYAVGFLFKVPVI